MAFERVVRRDELWAGEMRGLVVDGHEGPAGQRRRPRARLRGSLRAPAASRSAGEARGRHVADLPRAPLAIRRAHRRGHQPAPAPRCAACRSRSRTDRSGRRRRRRAAGPDRAGAGRRRARCSRPVRSPKRSCGDPRGERRGRRCATAAPTCACSCAGRCRAHARATLERHLGGAFPLPGDLERVMLSFTGRPASTAKAWSGLADALNRRQRTYWHLEALRRMPTDYEIATSQLLYYVGRGFEVELPLVALVPSAISAARRWPATTGIASAIRARPTYANYVRDCSRPRRPSSTRLLRSIEDSDYDRALVPGG